MYMVALWCSQVEFELLVNPHDFFTEVLWDCPWTSGLILEQSGKNGPVLNDSKHNKTQTLNTFLGMYCVSLRHPVGDGMG